MSCLALVFSSLYGAALANSNSLSNAKSWVEECKKASDTCSLGKVCSTPKMLNSSNSDGSWFIFTPETSGRVSIESTQNENDEAYFAVYGDSCLSPIANENGQGTSFYAEMDKEYRIFATSSFIVNSREYEYCSNANPIGSFPFSYNGQTKGYPYTTGECTGQIAQGTWFVFNGNGKSFFVSMIETSSVGHRWGTLLEVYTMCKYDYPRSCVKSVESYDELGSMVVFNTSSENTYYVFAGSRVPDDDGINFTMTIALYDIGNNSQCEQGTLIPGIPYGFSGTTLDKEMSNLTCNGVHMQRKGSWFHYTHSIEKRMVSVSTCEHKMSMLNAKIEVYSSCNESICVGEGNYSDVINCTVATFIAVPGQEYNVFVTANDPSSPGDFYHVDFLDMDPKPYDNYTNPEVQKVFPVTEIRHTVGADLSWDECSGGYRPGYWTTIVGNGKTYHATTKGDQTSFETSISVYEIHLNKTSPFTCVVYNESLAYSVDTSVSWKTENHHLYYIFVSSHKNDTGIFTLKVFEAEIPVTSRCLTPEFIYKVPSVKHASTIYANYSESGCVSGVSRRGIWYAIRGESHWIHLSTCDSMTDFDTSIEVYFGCNSEKNSGTSCVPVVRDGSCGSKDVVSFRGNKNVYYWVFVTARDGAIPDTGFYSLSITSGEYFYELNKPIIFYVFVGYAILFAFFSCIGIVVAIISFIVAYTKKRHVGYLKIIN